MCGYWGRMGERLILAGVRHAHGGLVKPKYACALALLRAFAMLPAGDSAARDRAQRQAFMREHPCPSTGKTRGACRGYVVDHVIPLCAGGADHPSNMQWQTESEA